MSSAPLFARGYLVSSRTDNELLSRLEASLTALRSMTQDAPAPGLDNLAAGLLTALRSDSKEARLIAACCLADVLRIYAPDAPYSDAQKLVRASAPSFGRARPPSPALPPLITPSPCRRFSSS
jgi:hypothetical protein